jgi:2'-5' RNA ligase
VRLFVAFELPRQVRERIARSVESVRAALPPARWVPAERLHLTLDFLGEVEEERLPSIERALAPVFAAAPPLRMRLGAPGTFPPRRPARVAWVAVEADGDLAALERRARAALDAVLPAALEDRPYHAHVTLARPRRPWAARAIDAFRNALAAVEGEWVARRAVLMESHLGSEARYEVRHQYPLGTADPEAAPP